MAYEKIEIPTTGEKIYMGEEGLVVPDQPIIPYIEGDGIGVDISPAMIAIIAGEISTPIPSPSI